MDTKNKILMLMMLASLSTICLSQGRNNIAVTNRSSSMLNISSINSAGKAVDRVLDNTQWINYAIEVNPNDPLLSISASIASGNIPSGVEVYLEADHDHGTGWGKTGKPVGRIKIGNVPEVLINEIGTCATGNGKFHGHKLTVSVVITDYALLQSGDFNLYIQYTLN